MNEQIVVIDGRFVIEVDRETGHGRIVSHCFTGMLAFWLGGRAKMFETLVLCHALAGVEVKARAYQRGVNAAMIALIEEFQAHRRRAILSISIVSSNSSSSAANLRKSSRRAMASRRSTRVRPA